MKEDGIIAMGRNMVEVTKSIRKQPKRINPLFAPTKGKCKNLPPNL